MRRRHRGQLVIARAMWPVAMATLVGACIASAPTGINRITDGEGGEGAGLETTNAASSTTGLPVDSDPHAVLATSPPHGPFTGGQAVVITGKGFESDVRVWFGEVEADGVIPIDPTKVQVNAPPFAEPMGGGTVDVHAQNGDDTSTRRTLIAGYTYDGVYAAPNSGPVSGGTVISIIGNGTDWSDGVEARIDQKPCTTLTVVSPTELSCTVPQGTPGTKAIGVEQDGELLSALDAYTYEDSSNGFKGGLSGAPLDGSMKVLVYNNFTGDPIPGAHVVLGTEVSTNLTGQVDGSGVIVFDDPALDAPTTVTVSAECHSPISFVDVPVDTATVYLDPVLTPQCAGEGDPPPVGGNPVLTGSITGELVWESGQEFQKGPWINVPAPNDDESRVAYQFFATRNAAGTFNTPGSNFTVTEASEGDLGYGFTLTQRPGNHTMYALAGLRNDDTGEFTAFVMGLIQGVAVAPGESTGPIYINMNNVFDQAMTMNASPPPVGAKGPDRLDARVIVEIAQSSYAILPGAKKTPLIPLAGPVSFVGLPALDGELTGTRYIASARAVSGPSLSAPLSVVGDIATNTTAFPLDVSGFVAVPELLKPVVNSSWDGRNLSVTYPAGGFPADLTVYEIVAAGGLMRWQVAVPKAAHSTTLPDLRNFPGEHLPDGPLSVNVYGARIEDFDYGSIGFRQLRPAGMTAYSLDAFAAQLTSP